MATEPLRNVCDMMARAIKLIEQEITAKERRIRILRQRIQKLQSQPNPDLIQINENKADIQELEDQLETDRPQLRAFQEEFATSCGP